MKLTFKKYELKNMPMQMNMYFFVNTKVNPSILFLCCISNISELGIDSFLFKCVFEELFSFI